MSLGFLLAVVMGACNREPIDLGQSCYEQDPNGDWPLAPNDLSKDYCGRGPTANESEEEGRDVTAVCLPAPEGGCDPCLLSAEEVDARLRDAIDDTFADAGCPEDYEPERFVRGCFAAFPSNGQCCYTAEYFTIEAICDPVPDQMP